MSMILLAMAMVGLGQPGGAATEAANPDVWRASESVYLGTPRQLTFPQQFVKAGESYFDPSGDWVIFQAISRPKEGEGEADPFYAMFVAKLDRALPGESPAGNAAAKEGGPTHFALSNLERVSPAGSANTCGWFHPVQPGAILMASTVARPADEQKSGFQVGSRRYVWMFPDEMEIVTVRSEGKTRAAITRSLDKGLPKDGKGDALSAEKTPALVDGAVRGVMKNNPLTVMFARPKYDAECSYDKSGRFVLYTHVEENSPEGKPHGNIYVYDTKTKRQHALVVAPGYDGGPFFSPDGRSICYRSDRTGNDLLQLFVADLRFEVGADGIQVPVGIEREWQITSNEHVNWAPYWHPSGEYLVYASSEAGHTNYEVFAATLDWKGMRTMPAPAAPATDPVANASEPTMPATEDASALTPHTRITHAPGADVLPAFSADGKWLIWTSQRGEKIEGEARPSSQLWVAEWKGLK
jgi:TolB protein